MNTVMRAAILVPCLSLVTAVPAWAALQESPAATASVNFEAELLALSREKWLWMADRNMDSLTALFHDDAVFVHMGGTMSRDQELGIIQSGGIQYKRADIHDASVRVMGSTAVVLNRITLLAVVGGNEVTNPFVVTEVYVRQDDDWKLGALSFTRLQQ